MSNQKKVISAQAVSIRGNDIDTDRIIPARFAKFLDFERLGQYVFEDDRAQEKQQGKLHPLDDSAYANAQIMFVNNNFGCGSSREHAPQAIARWRRGIKVIIGESFAEIFLGNCTALNIICATANAAKLQKLMTANERNPRIIFHLNLQELTIAYEDKKFPIFIPEGSRQQFISGSRNTLMELIKAKEKIVTTAAKLPYFNHWNSTFI